MIFQNTYNSSSITEEGKVGMKFTIYISNLSQKCFNTTGFKSKTRPLANIDIYHVNGY